eukprot:snap_masked-scaffold_3-processed-gene-7.13-mRNA-1 protein AED:1.00 eAED:1.00 QI:0/-1/0/0/-1/1/1/0/865
MKRCFAENYLQSKINKNTGDKVDQVASYLSKEYCKSSCNLSCFFNPSVDSHLYGYSLFNTLKKENFGFINFLKSNRFNKQNVKIIEEFQMMIFRIERNILIFNFFGTLICYFDWFKSLREFLPILYNFESLDNLIFLDSAAVFYSSHDLFISFITFEGFSYVYNLSRKTFSVIKRTLSPENRIILASRKGNFLLTMEISSRNTFLLRCSFFETDEKVHLVFVKQVPDVYKTYTRDVQVGILEPSLVSRFNKLPNFFSIKCYIVDSSDSLFSFLVFTFNRIKYFDDEVEVSSFLSTDIKLAQSILPHPTDSTKMLILTKNRGVVLFNLSLNKYSIISADEEVLALGWIVESKEIVITSIKGLVFYDVDGNHSRKKSLSKEGIVFGVQMKSEAIFFTDQVVLFVPRNRSKSFLPSVLKENESFYQSKIFLAESMDEQTALSLKLQLTIATFDSSSIIFNATSSRNLVEYFYLSLLTRDKISCLIILKYLFRKRHKSNLYLFRKCLSTLFCQLSNMCENSVLFDLVQDTTLELRSWIPEIDHLSFDLAFANTVTYGGKEISILSLLIADKGLRLCSNILIENYRQSIELANSLPSLMKYRMLLFLRVLFSFQSTDEHSVLDILEADPGTGFFLRSTFFRNRDIHFTPSSFGKLPSRAQLIFSEVLFQDNTFLDKLQTPQLWMNRTKALRSFQHNLSAGKSISVKQALVTKSLRELVIYVLQEGLTEHLQYISNKFLVPRYQINMLVIKLLLQRKESQKVLDFVSSLTVQLKNYEVVLEYLYVTMFAGSSLVEIDKSRARSVYQSFLKVLNRFPKRDLFIKDLLLIEYDNLLSDVVQLDLSQEFLSLTKNIGTPNSKYYECHFWTRIIV